jgi:formylglycine-generating enzyme required for sulfatase activity
MQNLLDILGFQEEDKAWLVPELFRRAARCFESAGDWRDAAECWAEAGETDRAVDLYRQLGDHATAGELLLEAEQPAEALTSYRAWQEALDPKDVVGQMRARLGQAACQILLGERKAGLADYRAARARIEDEAGRAPVTAGRCWEALGWYGGLLGRHDLVQIGYEIALRRYEETHRAEWLRAAKDYLAQVEDVNYLLAQQLSERIAELEDDGEKREWEIWRDELEGLGFRDGVQDVLHFADEERQLELWGQLAVLIDDPDQAEIDDYLRGLAPAGMVYVPAGPFLMGSSDDDPDADDDEKPQHEVTLAGYYIGRTPVTNAEYAAFIGAGGYQEEEYWTEAGWARKERDGWTEPRYWGDESRNAPQQPVVGVSWYEAVAYSNWLGARLPTEAEWEKAAGWDPDSGGNDLMAHPAGGRKRRYPWGDEYDEDKYDRQSARWHPVGSFSPEGDSAYAMADMAGRYDWCNTQWASFPYLLRDDREQLEGTSTRVVRGGGYSEARWARCAFRNRDYPWYWNYYLGFRVVAPHRLLAVDSES